MKFITESEIKTMYAEKPFEVFAQPKNTKLTPEARQWLLDRKLLDYKNDPREICQIK
jgi:ethanolamine utilization cobalamin adenosyltransferase